MIELQTGLPGAGKTLYTLVRIKAKAERENRPVYYSGIPDLNLPWIELEDPTRWFDLPPNSICVIDECQRIFRPRAHGSKVPEYVEQLETHRHKGLDLVLITQHPMLVDSNVRRLVGKHFHSARPFGWKKSVIFEYESCKENPLAASAQGARHDFIYPKDAFTWYKSAEVHTHKGRLPWQVVALVGVPLVVGGCGWYVYSHTFGGSADRQGVSAQAPGAPASSVRPDRARTAGQYLAEYQPRVPGLDYTAPVYDEAAKPVHAPYPAACVELGDDCRCYSQQATRLNMTPELCRSIVKDGFFLAWDTDQRKGSREGSRPQHQEVASLQPAVVSATAVPWPYESPAGWGRSASASAVQSPQNVPDPSVARPRVQPGSQWGISGQQ